LAILRSSERMKPTVLPAWSRVLQPASLHMPIVVEDARGWPMLALQCEHLTMGPDAVPHDVRDGIKLEPALLGSGPYAWLAPRAIPLRPIWSGFLVNTLFYAAILAVLFLAPERTRRTLRRRRGRCITCNYDRRGIPDGPCPECGTL
jgi:hypothetical protein